MKKYDNSLDVTYILKEEEAKRKRPKVSFEVQAMLDSEDESEEGNFDALRGLDEADEVEISGVEAEEEEVEADEKELPLDDTPDTPDVDAAGEVFVEGERRVQIEAVASNLEPEVENDAEVDAPRTSSGSIAEKRAKKNKKKRKKMLKSAAGKMWNAALVVEGIKKKISALKANFGVQQMVEKSRVNKPEFTSFTDMINEPDAVDVTSKEGYGKVKERGYNPVTDPDQAEEYVEHKHDFDYALVEKKVKSDEQNKIKIISGLKAKMSLLMYSPRKSLSDVIQNNLREKTKVNTAIEGEYAKKTSHFHALKEGGSKEVDHVKALEKESEKRPHERMRM